MRAANLKRDYGITVDDYDQMHEEQGGVCATCGCPETEMFRGKVRRLSVDHCHETGLVRGLLCGKCNKALGMIRDNVGTLRKMISYLERCGK